MRSWLISLCLACAVLGPASRAATIRVPEDQPTLQAGIDAAQPGDLVSVAPGVYTGPGNRDLTFRGKAITLASRDGAGSCILDAELQGRGVEFRSGEGSDSVLRGLTIRNGWSRSVGGGIRCLYSSPTIEGCRIEACSAYYHGGGIDGYESAMILLDCTITACEAGSRGGGICCTLCAMPVFQEVAIQGCRARSQGGGYFSEGAPARFVLCSIQGCEARFGGGAALTDSAVVQLAGCWLDANQAGEMGGGLYLRRSEAELQSCTFRGNGSTGRGGAICCERSTARIGGSILWGDAAPEGPEIALVAGTHPPPSLTIDWSDVQGGQAAVWVDAGASLVWGDGLLDLPPRFTGPPGGAPTLSQTAAGQLEQSPCVDAGGVPAPEILLPALEGDLPLSSLTTRTDGVPDEGTADLGAHFRP